MELEEARAILNECDRHELRDHAFGDMEIAWTKRGYEVAYGFMGATDCGVHIVGDSAFEGDDARTLVACGTLAHVERNDDTGPIDFVLGRIMPGLTREAVRQAVIKQRYMEKRDMNDYRRKNTNGQS